MNYTQINQQLKDRFIANKNNDNLEKYAMSELLPLIEDYGNYIKIITDNINIITNLNLIYIAVDASSMMDSSKPFFIEYLDSKFKQVCDKDKSIIYYLKALFIKNNDKYNKESKLYKELLTNSIKLSKDFNFVNNRLALSKEFSGEDQKQLITDAYNNIEHIFEPEQSSNDSLEDLLNCENYVKEFILGTYRNKLNTF